VNDVFYREQLLPLYTHLTTQFLLVDFSFYANGHDYAIEARTGHDQFRHHSYLWLTARAAPKFSRTSNGKLALLDENRICQGRDVRLGFGARAAEWAA
jgi:hypothetical protein